ncbi:cobalamin biosynthesis protein [Tessaracoccus sp. MC1865]|uniref:cobalamin biosynthesis protein n=1 Tax=Tessaracoccus sp. MC1865 TaxID=2760310 RepID=UPI001601996A|nr:cobalamin biosynthesis protein [Tessaracoccus sp. MC1865]MBB1484116.1 cobalamin biosynthesis protein [Tessaracoccus sp. MC1865]QTO37145.1 cobalamin biosynthesis protein [Tessaracoccus sp. MC1865]
MISRALGLALGVLADQIVGDPRRHHPVAWFGSFAARAEAPLYGDNVAAGAVYTTATVAPVAALGVAAERLTRRHPVLHTAATALATWAVLGARSLAREGDTMADSLEIGDLARARAQLPNLCGRDAAQLDEPELARATVESMAENTADSAVASLFWGALLGIPGLLGHRAVNTLDAMVGRRDERYGRFGTASAKLDDALDLLPARLTGVLGAALAPAVGGSARRAWAITLRDAGNHPSPNGGWCEAAWAGAIGVQLGGRNVYANRVEERGRLGDGPRPGACEVRKAAQLVTLVTGAATALAAGFALLRRGRR